MARLGPYDTGRVYLGDCLELMRAIPDGSVPMIWTDPPYGHNNNNNDLIHRWEEALGQGDSPAEAARPILNDSPADMERVVRGMLAEAGRVLAPDCCCCCCCCGGGGPNPTFARVAMWMDEKPLSFFHAVVWDKGGLGMGWRYRRNYEMVMVAHRRNGKLAWAYEGNDAANVVRIGKIIPQADQHPTQKPVELVRHFLNLHTRPGDLVLDPFAGSGTTGVACAEMGREFIGFELDPHWAEVANDRIAAARRGITVPEVKHGQSTLWA